MSYGDLWSNHSDCMDGNGNPKRRYFSYAQAQETADYLKQKLGVILRVYHCDDCGYYHLTKHIFY